MKTITLSLTLGVLVGWLATPAVAQTALKVTPSGGWNLLVDCDAKPTLTIAVDGATAVPAAGVTWTGTIAPFTATIPFSQMPAAARTVGPHTLVVGVPATSVTLADGSLYTYPAGLLTVLIDVLPDTPPPATPPRNPRWLKIAGTIALVVIGGLWAILRG